MPTFEIQAKYIVDEVYLSACEEERGSITRAKANQDIVAAHLASLASVIGEDDEVGSDGSFVGTEIPSIRNILRAEQRKRAGL